MNTYTSLAVIDEDSNNTLMMRKIYNIDNHFIYCSDDGGGLKIRAVRATVAMRLTALIVVLASHVLHMLLHSLIAS